MTVAISRLPTSALRRSALRRSAQRRSQIECRRHRRQCQRGFTLLELLVVLGILALLATFAGPQVMGYLGRAKTETARSQINAITTALELYALDNGGYPPAQVGLAGLVQPPPSVATWKGPYIKRSFSAADPWGRPYQYRHPGRNAAVEVFTFGRDNAPGGTGEDQDIVSW